MRTTPVEVGTKPYNWNTQYVYECTWYCYGRCGEKSLPFPTWWDRATETGSYTHAKKWLENYRDPWIPMGKDYIPVENDIVVFDGEYGHVAFIEKVDNGVAILSQYKNGDPNSFSNYAWKIGTDYTGNLLGYLHCPINIVPTVDRNPSVDQIETTDITLRVREKPSLDSLIVGHVQLGYYNVLDTEKSDGYTWYKIAPNKWCANLTVNFLSAEDDIIRKLEEYFNNMKAEVGNLKDENSSLKQDMNSINEITKRWI